MNDRTESVAWAIEIATGIPKDDERVRAAAERVLAAFEEEIGKLGGRTVPLAEKG